MRSLAFIAVIALFLTGQQMFGQAQVPITTTSVDESTYRHWVNREWDELIDAGNEALRAGIDFYYLRYRMGVAWYEKKNYQKASVHFQIARDMNPSDDTLNEYLYFSYLFAGWPYEASAHRQLLTYRQKRVIGLAESGFWKQAYAAYGSQTSASDNAVNRLDLSALPEGSQTIARGYHLFNLGAEHRLSNRMWLHHSYTHIQKESFRYINTEVVQSLDPVKKFWLNQYYLGATILLRPRLDVKFGFHYLNTLYYEDTLVTVPGRPRMVSTSFTDHSFVGFATLNRRFNGFSAGATSYIGNLNDATQFQQDLRLTLTPFGNLNFYSTSVVTFQSEWLGNDSRQEIIADQIIGLKILEPIWAEAGVTFGDLTNILRDEGIAVFNDPDIIKKKIEFRIYALLTNRIQVRLHAALLEKESRFISEVEAAGIPGNISYSTHSLSATLLWNF